MCSWPARSCADAEGVVAEGGAGVRLWGTVTDGTVGVLGTVTEGGVGVDTAGVVTVVTGVGTVTLGTVTLGTVTLGVGTLSDGSDVVGRVTAPLLATPASRADTSRPRTAAEMRRIFRDMVPITVSRSKTCANTPLDFGEKSDPRARYYRDRAPVDRSLPSERASTRR